MPITSYVKLNKYIWYFVLLMSSTLICCKQEYKYTSDSKIIENGKNLFELKCASCHNFKSSGIGPNLSGITELVDHKDLVIYITNFEKKINQGDERAKRLLKEYKTIMPDFDYLSNLEIESISAFLSTKKKASESTNKYGTPLTNPIPDTIVNSGLTLELELVIQVPATSEELPRARINKMLSIPKSRRIFIHDLNGILYEIIENKPIPFLEIKDYFENFVSEPGLGSGLGSFAFHPEYLNNGVFYTSHTEIPDSLNPADFTYNDSIPKKIRWILTEWEHKKPEESLFSGSKRELLSIDMLTQIHGMQEITFNPLSKIGSKDYGKLYVSIGDGGSAENKYTSLTQDLSKIWGSILRIDPAGNNSKNKQYGIPANNPFVNNKDAIGEIWAYGFRNPHRISWDSKNENMLASEIGHHRIEEINLIQKGKNYGWPIREGTFKIYTDTDMKNIFPLDIKEKKSFTYPVAQFDHDEGTAISGGYVYYGNNVPELQGKYIFGTIVEGRIFITVAEKLELGKQAKIEEVNISIGSKITDLKILTSSNRVHLRLGQDAEGELYIFTKTDGKIYKILGTKEILEN